MAQVVDPSQAPDGACPAISASESGKILWTQQQKRDMVKKQNEQRQQDIKKDTDQLLDLATD